MTAELTELGGREAQTEVWQALILYGDETLILAEDEDRHSSESRHTTFLEVVREMNDQRESKKKRNKRG